MNPKEYISNRAGRVVKQPSGYYSFLPEPLPPKNPPLKITAEIISLHGKASRAIGELKGVTSIISDPDLFVYLFVRKEALLSSQIEGTQCSLEDILDEDNDGSRHNQQDVTEVSNYINAMNYSLERVHKIPISNRLLKETHKILLQDVRGQTKDPGSFKKSPNWIGSPGATLESANFVPPPPEASIEGMSNLEKYIHTDDEMPKLIKAGLIHAQFETLHPFLDGNGRLGRLLITLLLCHWEILDKPLVYLSYFFKANRTEYYQKLTNIRSKGEWESWIQFFLQGIIETSEIAQQAAKDIYHLHNKDRATLHTESASQKVLQVFEAFCKFPILTVPELAKTIEGSNQNTLNRAIKTLLELKLLEQTTNQKRNRKFVYRSYMNILTRDTSLNMG
ncbi:Fic family protein [bacterium]|nr:Fic family protein [bacterium]